ncbi:MAG: DUF4998 domain-containing protein [Mangrovibacterium sp.]
MKNTIKREWRPNLFEALPSASILRAAKQLLYIMIGIVWCLSSCKEMDSLYEEYIVPNGITYPGKALNPVVYAGKNRVKISWLRGSDPKVVKARIYWNNYTDSANVDVPAGEDTISHIVSGLPENSYSFFIRTFDNKGNVSIPVEVMGTSYGERYQATLLNRAINTYTITGTTVTVSWTAIDTVSAYATEIWYTDVAGASRIMYTMSNESVSTISDIKKGTDFTYRTSYVPNHFAIDTFYTAFLKISVPIFDDKFDWLGAGTSAAVYTATNEKRFETWESSYGTTNGWSSTKVEDAGGALQPWLYSRLGYIKFGKTACGGDLITPKLVDIDGTKDIVVSFKAHAYMPASGSGFDNNEFNIEVVGPGEVTQILSVGSQLATPDGKQPSSGQLTAAGAQFMIGNYNNPDAASRPNWLGVDYNPWAPEYAERSFVVSGATKETQIRFIGGPNIGVTPTSFRFGFDDVRVVLK